MKLLDAEYNEAAEKLINAAPSSVPETSSENADLKKIVDTSLNDDYLTPERKAAAKQVIEEVYASKQKELQNTPNATQEEIDAAIEEATKIAEEAKKAINNPDVNTTEEIAAIEKTAIQEIEKVTVTPTSKEAARAEIDALAKAQTELIDNNKLLTDKEKEAAKDVY